MQSLLIGVGVRHMGRKIGGDGRAQAVSDPAPSCTLLGGRRQHAWARAGGAEHDRHRTIAPLRDGKRDRVGERAALAHDLGEAPAQRRARTRHVEAERRLRRARAWSHRCRGRSLSLGCVRVPFGPGNPHARAERDEAGRPVRGGIGERDAAADRPVIADRPIGNLAGDAAASARRTGRGPCRLRSRHGRSARRSAGLPASPSLP